MTPALLLAASLAPGQPPEWKVPAALSLRKGGVNEDKERIMSVARGVKWLANQQRPGGFWEFDPKDRATKRNDAAAATGLALLPYLGVGITHKAAASKYQKTVADGLAWLTADLNPETGVFARAGPADHALPTLALCEAYALTGDRALLPPATAAVRRLVATQGADGGWGDRAATVWHLQVLRAARLTPDIPVPDEAIAKVVGFLARGPAAPPVPARDDLIRTQSGVGNDAGSWPPAGPGGRVGATAHALLLLEAPFRYANLAE